MKSVWLEAGRLDQEAAWTLRTGVAMPDHVHLLVEVSSLPGLAGVVRLFKGRLAPTLRKAGLKWQPAYFDHRRRPDEDRLPVFLYIYLNPYRAKLHSEKQTWPGYFCSQGDWRWFGPLTSQSCPIPEWLA
ncbi:MAG: transposase [bacterium]|nr:transposase [bacterium]MDI1335526.1 transposase [Lacunisphaera sp.]